MIYLLEDDASIRELITYTLNSQGLEALGFAKPSDFWAAMQEKLPSLILLDIMLPEEDGLHRGASTIQCWDWTAVRTTTFPNPSA